MREAAQLVAHVNVVRRGGVHIALAEDDHADVAVEIDLAGLGADEPAQTCLKAPDCVAGLTADG